MTRYNQNFEMIQGDTLYINVPIYDIGNKREPLNDVSEITWAVSSWADQPSFMTKTLTGGGVEILNSDEGYIRIELDPSDTAQLSDDYYHECEFEFTNGDVSTAFVGNMKVHESSTEQ